MVYHTYLFSSAEAKIIKTALEEYMQQHVFSNEHEYSRQHIEHALSEIQYADVTREKKEQIKALQFRELGLMQDCMMIRREYKKNQDGRGR